MLCHSNSSYSTVYIQQDARPGSHCAGLAFALDVSFQSLGARQFGVACFTLSDLSRFSASFSNWPLLPLETPSEREDLRWTRAVVGRADASERRKGGASVLR